MSQPMCEVEAKLLIDHLSIRDKLLNKIRAGHARYRWTLYLLQLTVALVFSYAWWRITGEPRESIVLCGLYMAVSACIQSHFNYSQQRLDALVKLLKQEGSLSTQAASPVGDESDHDCHVVGWGVRRS